MHKMKPADSLLLEKYEKPRWLAGFFF